MKINEFNNVAKTTLDEWIYYLKNATLPKNYRAKGLSLVAEKLKLDKMKVEELKSYQKYKDKVTLSKSAWETAYFEGEFKGKAEGIAEGKADGKAKGKLEEKTNTVLNAYKKGLSIALISDIVNLSEDEVKKILIEKGCI